MADVPELKLVFPGGCPDCGRRDVTGLPAPLPQVEDDFDWEVRDYDGFRMAMLQEMAARFPERKRWTPADLEVVLAEVLAAVLDQLSDMADRVAAEAYLETARRPESLRRLLKLIAYDPAAEAGLSEPDLDSAWHDSPSLMERARQEGPRRIHVQHRMVTARDYAERLQDHPLVLRARSWSEWGGSWETVHAAVLLVDNLRLDEDQDDAAYDPDFIEAVNDFHAERGLPAPRWGDRPTLRTLLRPYLDAYRMIGQEVLLRDAVQVPVLMAFSIQVADNYFLSEVRGAVDVALGTGPGGFFERGRLRFGEDLHAGDLFQVLTSLDGVDHVCLNRFQRMGSLYLDQSDGGHIELEDLEIAVCDNDPADPARGYYRLSLHGGRRG